MLNSIYQNIKFLIGFSLLFFAIVSCEPTKSNELKVLSSLLDQNHTFNTKRLNRERAKHYKEARFFREIKTEVSREFNAKYEQLIAKIDHAISTKESNIASLTQAYNSFMTAIQKALNTYYKDGIDLYSLKVDSLDIDTESHLKIMKHNLTLTMMYAYQIFTGNIMSTSTGSRYLRVKTIAEQNERQTKIILISNIFPDPTVTREIVVDKIVYRGFEKKFNYKIVPNYAFSTIILDSLTAGNYEIEGTVQYFDRNGTSTVPFHEIFDVD